VDGLKLPELRLERGDVLVKDRELPLQVLSPPLLGDGLRILRDLVKLVFELVTLQVKL